MNNTVDLNENIVDKQLNGNRHKDLKHEEECEESKRVDIRHEDLDLENNLNIEHLSTVSGSSVEPRSHCSCTLMENILNANEETSFELQHCIPSHTVPLPDLMAASTDLEDDFMSVTSSAMGDGTWESNWLFRKKKHNSSGSATISSVGMLVPDPTEDIRAQIGDKTTDEVSDLSEFGSDTDDSLDILQSKLEPISDRLINKHLIGGANDKIILDELIERSSIVSNTLLTKREQLYTDTLNEHVVDAPTRHEAVNDKIHEQTNDVHDGNYEAAESISIEANSNSLEDHITHNYNPSDNKQTTTVEDYIDSGNDKKEYLNHCLDNCFIPATTTNTTSTTASTEVISNKNTNNITITSTNLPIITYKSPNKLLTSAAEYKDVFASCSASAGELFNNCMHEHQTNPNKQIINVGDGDIENSDENNDDDDSDESAILRHFLPGSIAEREYKKWYNAVEMPNNPYAPEALKRRISGSQERFIDLPNISPTKELNTLNLFKTDNTDSDETQKRENDFKRYSRDYYINSSSTSSQSTPVKELSAHKDTKEHTNNNTLSYKNDESNFDLYKAIPVQVVENNSLTIDCSQLLQRSELEETATKVTTSDDSDTIKINDLYEQKTRTEIEKDQVESKPNEMSNKVESCLNISNPIRGSTPTAFKFLQPKRKLLEPSQVLSADEDMKHVVTTTDEKPVIEEEVAKALPSVKALARAFLLATNTTRPEKLWFQKPKTVTQSGKIKSITTKPSVPQNRLGLTNFEEDVTISSDLSSLETDSSSAFGEAEITVDFTNPSKHAEGGPIRHGDFKSNIAFFENLKNK